MTTDTRFLTPDDLYERALRCFGREQCAAAIALADACLALCPDHVDAWMLQAEVHLFEDRILAAIACLAHASAVSPENPVAMNRLVALYLKAGRPLDALPVARRLLEARPDDPDARYGHAVALARTGRRAEARAAFEALLDQNPDDAGSAIEAAWLALGDRDYRAGWRLWAQRFGGGASPAAVPGLPEWDGSPPDGRTILVVPEGGYGDTVWAVRFLPALQAAGAVVHFLCPPALVRLFNRLDGVDAWADDAGGPPNRDLQVSLQSLPGLLGVAEPQSHPPARLHGDPDWSVRRDALLDRARAPLRIGVIWSGSTDYGGNADRAARLTDFLPLAELPFVQLYSLQKGPPQRELIDAGLGDLVIDCDDFDFSETALLAQSLDVIVMTDSAVAHIAGSLGTPVWVLLDSFAHWYHGFEGDHSDWYPGMRLFRQKRPRVWSDVIGEVRDALTRVARRRKLI